MLKGKAKRLISCAVLSTTVLAMTACGSTGTDTNTAAGNQAAQDNTQSTNTQAAVDAQGSASATGGEVAFKGFEPYEEELNIHIGRLASQHTVSTLLPGVEFYSNVLWSIDSKKAVGEISGAMDLCLLLSGEHYFGNLLSFCFYIECAFFRALIFIWNSRRNG